MRKIAEKLAPIVLAILIWSIPALATARPSPVCTDLGTFVLCVEEGSVPFMLSEINTLVSEILQAGRYPPVTITFTSHPSEERPGALGEYRPETYDIIMFNPNGLQQHWVYMAIAHELWHHRLQDDDAPHCAVMQSKEHWWSLKRIAREHNVSEEAWVNYAMYVAVSCMNETVGFGEEDTE